MAETKKKLKYKLCSICGHQVTWEWGNKPEKCPKCGAIHYDKPPMEAKLFNLQQKYVDTQDTDVIGEMFPLMKEYARRIVLQNLAGHVRYDETKLDTKASDTANKLTEYYLSKPNFVIYQSFGYYLDRIAKQNMFAKKLQDQDRSEFSMQEYVERHENNSNALDNLEYESETTSDLWQEKVESEMNIDFIVGETMRYFETMFKMLHEKYGYRDAMLQMILLRHFIGRASRRVFSKWWKVYGQRHKEIHEKVKLAFNEYARELSKQG